MSVEVKKLSVKKELLQVLLIFAFGGTVNLLIWGGDIFGTGFSLIALNFSVNGFFWVALWKGSEYLIRGLDKLFPWIDFPVKRLIVSVVAVVTYTILVVSIMDILIDLLLVKKSFLEAIQEINQASLKMTIYITLGINVIMHGRGFLFSWRQASIDNEKLRTEQVFTQFQSLKNQVNPHFLFNSLNALSSLVYEDQDKAVQFIRKLSQVYRYVLDKKDEEVVPIEDEIAFLENFIFLQKIRFGENLNFEIIGNVEGYLPPLSLQLLVENAIKHNVVSDDHPLEIKVDLKTDLCVITNNIKEKLSKDSTGIGLNNLKERYQYLSDKKVVIKNDGTSFVVELPILHLKAA